jgi:hypothetical protein
MTFNDYAEAKGLPNAQQWIFYSINDATADGKKLLGAGKNPEGQNVTFIMEFSDDPPVIATTPSSIDFGEVNTGTVSPWVPVTIRNSGGGNLMIESISLGGSQANQFSLNDNNSYPLSLGHNDSISVEVAFNPGSSGLKVATLDISGAGISGQVSLSGTGIPGVGTREPAGIRPWLFPNPAGEQVTVRLPQDATNVMVLNINGVLLFEQTAGESGSVTLKTGGLAAGVYWVKIERRSADPMVFKLVK